MTNASTMLGTWHGTNETLIHMHGRRRIFITIDNRNISITIPATTTTDTTHGKEFDTTVHLRGGTCDLGGRQTAWHREAEDMYNVAV